MLSLEGKSQSQQKIEAIGIDKQFRDTCLISVITYSEGQDWLERAIDIFLFKTSQNFLRCVKYRINVISLLSKSYQDKEQNMVR